MRNWSLLDNINDTGSNNINDINIVTTISMCETALPLPITIKKIEDNRDTL